VLVLNRSKFKYLHSNYVLQLDLNRRLLPVFECQHILVNSQLFLSESQKTALIWFCTHIVSCCPRRVTRYSPRNFATLLLLSTHLARLDSVLSCKDGCVNSLNDQRLLL